MAWRRKKFLVLLVPAAFFAAVKTAAVVHEAKRALERTARYNDQMPYIDEYVRAETEDAEEERAARDMYAGSMLRTSVYDDNVCQIETEIETLNMLARQFVMQCLSVLLNVACWTAFSDRWMRQNREHRTKKTVSKYVAASQLLYRRVDAIVCAEDCSMKKRPAGGSHGGMWIVHFFSILFVFSFPKDAVSAVYRALFPPARTRKSASGKCTFLWNVVHTTLASSLVQNLNKWVLVQFFVPLVMLCIAHTKRSLGVRFLAALVLAANTYAALSIATTTFGRRNTVYEKIDTSSQDARTQRLAERGYRWISYPKTVHELERASALERVAHGAAQNTPQLPARLNMLEKEAETFRVLAIWNEESLENSGRLSAEEKDAPSLRSLLSGRKAVAMSDLCAQMLFCEPSECCSSAVLDFCAREAECRYTAERLSALSKAAAPAIVCAAIELFSKKEYIMWWAGEFGSWTVLFYIMWEVVDDVLRLCVHVFYERLLFVRMCRAFFTEHPGTHDAVISYMRMRTMCAAGISMRSAYRMFFSTDISPRKKVDAVKKLK